MLRVRRVEVIDLLFDLVVALPELGLTLSYILFEKLRCSPMVIILRLQICAFALLRLALNTHLLLPFPVPGGADKVAYSAESTFCLVALGLVITMLVLAAMGMLV